MTAGPCHIYCPGPAEPTPRAGAADAPADPASQALQSAKIRSGREAGRARASGWADRESGNVRGLTLREWRGAQLGIVHDAIVSGVTALVPGRIVPWLCEVLLLREGRRNQQRRYKKEGELHQ
jgi:hypothetical protein